MDEHVGDAAGLVAAAAAAAVAALVAESTARLDLRRLRDQNPVYFHSDLSLPDVRPAAHAVAVGSVAVGNTGGIARTFGVVEETGSAADVAGALGADILGAERIAGSSTRKTAVRHQNKRSILLAASQNTPALGP